MSYGRRIIPCGSPIISTGGGLPFMPTFSDALENFSKTLGTSFRMNVVEYKDKYVVEAEVPNIPREQIHLDFTKDTLTIMVDNNNQKETPKNALYLIKERVTVGQTNRSITLSDVQPNQISAKLENGLLVITLPKQDYAQGTNAINID